jgi:hypothetical protein
LGISIQYTEEELSNIGAPVRCNYMTYFFCRGPENSHYKEEKIDRHVKQKYPIVKFEECLKIISSYVSNKVDKPKELNQKTISAFSYYYDRATENSLIGKCIAVRVLWKHQRSVSEYFSTLFGDFTHLACMIISSRKSLLCG